MSVVKTGRQLEKENVDGKERRVLNEEMVERKEEREWKMGGREERGGSQLEGKGIKWRGKSR